MSRSSRVLLAAAALAAIPGVFAVSRLADSPESTSPPAETSPSIDGQEPQPEIEFIPALNAVLDVRAETSYERSLEKELDLAFNGVNVSGTFDDRGEPLGPVEIVSGVETWCLTFERDAGGRATAAVSVQGSCVGTSSSQNEDDDQPPSPSEDDGLLLPSEEQQDGSGGLLVPG